MATREPPLTLGIEEEYLLVDRESGAVAAEPPDELFAALHERTAGRAFPEFLRAQVEVATPVCGDIAEARRELGGLRLAVIEEAARFGLAPIAASSHPFSLTSKQKRTDKERYVALLEEMQGAARRMMICGLHVHVMSFRLMIFNGVPRTGLPEQFSSWGEYRRHTDVLAETGVIADTSRIWWDLRPSLRYPTLETRVMDCCTSLEDALSLAALNQCLLRMLYRLRRANQRWRMYSHLLLGENRWRAMRYSYDAGLLDLGQQRIVPFAELLEELIAIVREDAEALGCVAEVERLREIIARGTSAHRQIGVYTSALSAGATEPEALKAVVDWLIEETARL